jgi:hypothetical protein
MYNFTKYVVFTTILALLTSATYAQTDSIALEKLEKQAQLLLSAKQLMLHSKFDEAINQLESYKVLVDGKTMETNEAKKLINMCEHGRYFMSQEATATIISSSEVGQTAVNELTTAVVTNDEKKIYFSQLTNETNSGKDIYLKKRLPKGEWAQAQALPKTVNSSDDDDFPVAKANVLYFSSKGHNSMGGYDIFKTTYDSTTNTWSTPENLGYPINSPYDDFAFMPSENGTEASFASTRNQLPDNQLTLYKVALNKKTENPIIINGTSSLSDVTITVFDLQDKSLIGIFRSNKQTGNYVVVLPSKNDNYLFQINSPAASIQSKRITIPAGYNGDSTLHQHIAYDKQTALLFTPFADEKTAVNFTNSTFSESKQVKAQLKELKLKAAQEEIIAKRLGLMIAEASSYELATKLESIQYIKQEESQLNLNMANRLKIYLKQRNDSSLVSIQQLETKLHELSLLDADTTLFNTEAKNSYFDTKQLKINRSVNYFTKQKAYTAEQISALSTELQYVKVPIKQALVQEEITSLTMLDSVVQQKIEYNRLKKEELSLEFQNYLNERDLFYAVQKAMQLDKNQDVAESKQTPYEVITKAPNNNTDSDVNIQGLYYSIQVGLYSRSVPLNTFFNLYPIFIKIEENNTIRYRVGMYNNLLQANKSKAIIRESGMPDAFIIAFYNGKKISIEAAIQLEQIETNKASYKLPNMNKLPYINSDY